MPCILFRSTSILSANTERETPLSRSPTVLDLPFLDPPKHVRFPCPFASPELFASTHQTYSQAEYDRTPIEPPSEEERSCALPGRGERCFDADGDERECDLDEGETEGAQDEDAVGSDEDEDEDDEEQIVRSNRSMFRCWTLNAQDDKDEGEEVEEEGETTDDQRAASPLALPCHPSSSKRHPSTPGPTRRPSSSCSPTTARRLQWLQTQTESLPTALRDRLLLLASSTSSPPSRSADLNSPSSPMSLASLCSSPSSTNYSVFSFAPRSPLDLEAEDVVDDDAEERTIHSSTPRPTSSFPVSFLADPHRPTQSTTVSDESEYFSSPTSFPICPTATSPPPRHPERLRIEREDSECSSSAGSRTTDEIEGFFYSPGCSSASSASDWGLEEITVTAETNLVAPDNGKAVEWEGLGKELGQLAGGFRVSRWAFADGDARGDDSRE